MGLFSKGITLSKKTSYPNLNLIETPLPKKTVLPLKQYIGEASTPTIKVGDKVKVGQIIANGNAESSLPLHATISGSITEITERLDHKGNTVSCLIIESDGTDTWIDARPPEDSLESLSPDEILERIHASGLISKGLLPVPLTRELSPADQPKTHLYLTEKRIVKKIDTLVIPALDTEPHLGVNRYLAGMEDDELSYGIEALKIITGALNTVFVVDTHTSPYPQLTDLVEKDEEEATKIISINGQRFPLALTVPLLKAVLGRELPLPYGHPRDMGVAIYDIDTVRSIGASVYRQIPQVELLITVGGRALSKTGIVKIRAGTLISELIESLGGLREDPAKIILGGPMMGMAQYSLDIPITKETPALFALCRDEIQLTEGYRECINCGLCVSVCPVNLIPGMLSMYCAKDSFEKAEAEGLLRCIECGCCDYVCPSRRPLVHLFRHAKNQLMETGSK